MKVGAEEAAKKLGLLDRLGNPFNAWAAAITAGYDTLNDEKYEETYRITKEEGKKLRKVMYPDL